MATFARRLLKGVGFGMHYQWGRKDPFTPSSATWSVEVQIYNADGGTIAKGSHGMNGEFKLEARTITTQTTINHLIQNPSTHYNKGDGTNNVPIASTEGYNDSNKEGDWWNPTIKTIYDPCPNGYRIPKYGTYGEAKDWTISTWDVGALTGGHTFNNATPSFFPVNGNRYYANGCYSAIGVGFGWMSNPQAYHLILSSGSIRIVTGYGRSHGMPVRCIKEQ